MKFWISCRSDDFYRTFTLHAEKPDWNSHTLDWWSLRRLVVCPAAVRTFLGEDYDLPKPGECWEFKTEETIWIHTG